MKLPANDPVSGNEGARVACDNCLQTFKNKIALRRHTSLYHTNTTRFKCPECDRVLSSRQNLSEHQNTHSGLKPYICDYEGCSLSFRQGSQLSVHRRIHKAIQQYRTKISEEVSLRLTECLKDVTQLDRRTIHFTIPGWVKLPPITTEKPSGSLLPSIHFTT